jgi:hypothetical protein
MKRWVALGLNMAVLLPSEKLGGLMYVETQVGALSGLQLGTDSQLSTFF